MPKLKCSLSLDLDNLWSYLKTHGDAGWDAYPSYLNVVVPRVLDFLDARGVRITWFIVGRDAADPAHRAALREIPARGHEVGNHSFNHEPWLHLYSEVAIRDELARTEDAIHAATGERPTGFRGPTSASARRCSRCWPSAATATTLRRFRRSWGRWRGCTTSPPPRG